MTDYTHPDSVAAMPYYQQALRGMAYIDQHSDNKQWVDDVPLDELDMDHDDMDILAYTLGRCHNNLDMSRKLGFYTDGIGDELTETWRVLLRLRQQLPELPDGHVFIGVGSEDNDTQYADIRHCYGWEEGIRWEDRWSRPVEERIQYNHVAYCVHRDHALARPYITQENEPMNDDTPELTLRSIDDGVVYQGYVLSEDDIEKLMTLVRATTTLRDVGYDVEVSEVSVGCKKFSHEQLNTLYAQYKKLKQQPQGFTVKMGDRVENASCGEVYIVASMGYTSYQLISLSNGNRWCDTTVESPEDKTAIPFVNFLDNPSDLQYWRKV